jgi:hypothetical protein
MGLKDWWAGRIDVSFFNQVCGYTAADRRPLHRQPGAIAPDRPHLPAERPTTDQSLTTGDEMSLTMIDKVVAPSSAASPPNPGHPPGEGRRRRPLRDGPAHQPGDAAAHEHLDRPVAGHPEGRDDRRRVEEQPDHDRRARRLQRRRPARVHPHHPRRQLDHRRGVATARRAVLWAPRRRPSASARATRSRTSTGTKSCSTTATNSASRPAASSA